MSTSESIQLTSDVAAQLCAISERHIRRNCNAAKYLGATKGADGWIIPLTSLPTVAQARYWEAQPPEISSAPPLALPILPSPPAVIDSDALHLAFRQAPAKSKARATKLYEAVTTFEALRTAGESKGRAESYVKEKHQIDATTLWRARETVRGHPQHLWEALLLPKYKGRAKEAEMTPAAWDWICSGYLTTSEPQAKVIIKEAKKYGKSLNWVFPSDKTIVRKLNALSAPIVALGRKGKTAFDANFPAAERDFTSYGLHNTWVSDGRRADVFCRWPDGTVARPFIVVWVDMRSRMVLGVRGGINPSQTLTLASLRVALERTNIKPNRALVDNGREYAGKQVSGGQKNRYRFKIKEDDPIGALTRMGIMVDWARPYRGQEKPVEAFWPYTANNVDKLPQFQGAYCGKNTVSKPEDFDSKKAIPIEIYAAKLAEIIEEFNTTHKHSGQGMLGSTPAQMYEELMLAEPHKDWLRPTNEDLYLMCCRQEKLTLNNKDATIKFKFSGYGDMRYGSDVLNDLPPSARNKKYNVYFNPDDPDIPVLVYDGMRMICAAPRIHMVGNKTQAAQHCINKAEFKKTRLESFNEIKKAGRQVLPAPAANVLPFAPIEISGKPAAPVATPEPPKLVPLENGQFYDPLTGKTIGKARIETAVEPEIDMTEFYQRKAAQLAEERLKQRFGTT